MSLGPHPIVALLYMPAAFDKIVKSLAKTKGVKNKYALANAIMEGTVDHKKPMMNPPKGHHPKGGK